MIQFRYVATEEFASAGAELMATHITRAIDDRGARLVTRGLDS